MDEDRLAARRADGMKRLRLATALGPLLALASTVTAVAAGGGAGGLNGIFRTQWTEKELIAGGTSSLYARRNRGVETLTLRDGRYLIRFSDPSGPDCRGTYKVAGKIFSLNFHVPTCPGGVGAITASWSLAHGELRFRQVQATDAGDAVFWGAKPWKKIG
jgi:hypothetical protein